MTKELKVTETEIPGLLIIDLPVHGDNRGWFKENWQREKMVAAGLPDFNPVQNNISFNASVAVSYTHLPLRLPGRRTPTRCSRISRRASRSLAAWRAVTCRWSSLRLLKRLRLLTTT